MYEFLVPSPEGMKQYRGASPHMAFEKLMKECKQPDKLLNQIIVLNLYGNDYQYTCGIYFHELLECFQRTPTVANVFNSHCDIVLNTRGNYTVG